MPFVGTLPYASVESADGFQANLQGGVLYSRNPPFAVVTIPPYLDPSSIPVRYANAAGTQIILPNGTVGSLGSGGGTTVALAGTSLTLDSSNTATYNGNVIATGSASATSIVVNTGAALTGGVAVIQAAAGIVTISGTATFNAPNGLSTSGPNTTLTLIPTATDTYTVLLAATADKTLVLAAAGATPAIAMNLYNVVDMTLSANCTPSFSGAVSGQSFAVQLIIRTGAGGFTLTLPGSITWVTGAALVLVATASKVASCVLQTVDGGASYLGYLSGNGV